ncbi:hypothetical protein [Microbacterium sp. 2FI]|uniref:hypothetical protein n=1 Tax=Microbacterium sp. 2FI TaxID=2502193 RepID=UPI0010F55091|nr:hypothetical protein [Microbacterium sp. 2FI]
MSTPEQPSSPPLTRKKLREIRNTGSTPIITDDGATRPAEAPASPEPAQTAPSEADQVAPPPVVAPVAAPLARAAEPVSVAPPPAADATVDLGVSPLTRRQARQQERIRTASVPVITPEVVAAHAVPAHAVPQHTVAMPMASLPFSDGPVTAVDAPAESEEPAESDPADDIWAPLSAASSTDELDEADEDPADEIADVEAEPAERTVVSPLFGAGLLAGQPVEVDLPPSFDQLLARSTTGSVSTSNALIISQGPEASPIVAPVTATGEVLITGTLNLPEGLGSTGHALGTTDGKDVDAVLVDSEIPAHSSPTPIAASAAISTVKSAGEIIQPPTPEKGGRLMMTLAITAGVLALALVGVLILAFVTGVF